MLLAGEKLKKKRKCGSGWGNVKNLFENVLLIGEILKKLKMFKNGGSHVCAQGIDTQTWLPPFLTFLTFLEFPQPEAHFKKKFLTFPQPEAHTPQKTLPLWKC